MKCSNLILILCATLMAGCATISPAPEKEVAKPKPSRQVAGFAYQTVSTSTILAAEVVGYCRDIGAKGYQQVDSSWSNRNLKWIKAADRMMADLAPDAGVRISITGQMDALSKIKAKQVVDTSIKSSKAPKQECAKMFEKINAGLIDIDKQQMAVDALSAYL